MIFKVIIKYWFISAVIILIILLVVISGQTSWHKLTDPECTFAIIEKVLIIVETVDCSRIQAAFSVETTAHGNQ